MLVELVRNVAGDMVTGDIGMTGEIVTEVVENGGSIFDNKWVKGSLYVAGAATIGYGLYKGYKYIKAGIDSKKVKEDLYAKYEKDMAKYKADVQDVEADLKEAEKEVARLKKEAANIGAEIKKEFETKMAAMEEHIKSLESEKETLNKEIEKINNDLKDNISALADMKSTNESLNTKNKEYETKIEELGKIKAEESSEEQIKKAADKTKK